MASNTTSNRPVSRTLVASHPWNPMTQPLPPSNTGNHGNPSNTPTNTSNPRSNSAEAILYPNGGVYLVRRNWQGKGFRLYFADSPRASTCSQVDGEIQGQVFRSVGEAKAYALMRFGQLALYLRAWQ